MQRYNVLLILAILTFILIGCSNSPPDATVEGAPDGEPAFTAPTPASEQVGTVTGQLTGMSDGEPAPVILPLYLGSVLVSEEGIEGLVEMDRSTSPKAQPDGFGNFAFPDVEPGRYGLMVDTPNGAILLKNPNNGDSMVIEVQGGEMVELGELRHNIDFGV